MQQILVYADSLSWGIIPGSRHRLPFHERWPGALEIKLKHNGHDVRIIEDCLNGRRTVWSDPFKSGRNGAEGLAQRMEIHSPLALVVLMLGTNDFQSVHDHRAWHSAQGMTRLIHTIRQAPMEPGMPVPPILVIAPPAIDNPRRNMSEKFRDADKKSAGLAAALATVCDEQACAFCDAGTLIHSSAVDGVHIDAAEHLILAEHLANIVPPLLVS